MNTTGCVLMSTLTSELIHREALMSRAVFTFKHDIFIDQKHILHLKALNKT